MNRGTTGAFLLALLLVSCARDEATLQADRAELLAMAHRLDHLHYSCGDGCNPHKDEGERGLTPSLHQLLKKYLHKAR